VLTIKLKAKVPGLPMLSAEDVAKYKFIITSVGSSIMAWDAANPSGKPTINGDILEARITFSGLPINNAAFGRKTARLAYAGIPVVDQPFEVFFKKFTSNHPGSPATTPNWFYYWMQTSANKTNTTTVFNNIQSPSFYSFLDGMKIYIAHDAATIGPPMWYSPTGIDCFAWVTAHEAKHHSQKSGFWSGGYIASRDQDDDEIPSDIEPIYMLGRSYNPSNAFTYQDTIGYNWGQIGFMIKDSEDIAVRSQIGPNYDVDQLWENGSADSSDWANPGKNSKHVQ